MDGTGTSVKHCYCKSSLTETHMLLCKTCNRRFHSSCLKTGPPSPLAGDIYFRFVCEDCSKEGKEIVERMKLQWTLVVILALYNLQVQGGGKCGYFRWREDICRFVDKNWIVLFGADRKKAATWHHTVAGILSACCNKYFLSGSEQLQEKGWWTLKEMKLPTLEELEAVAGNKATGRRTKQPPLGNSLPIIEGPRQRQHNILEAALALKAKRTAVDIVEPSPKSKKSRNEKLELKIRLSNDDSLYQSEPGPSGLCNSATVVCKTEPNTGSYNNADRYSSTDSSLSNSRTWQEGTSEVSGSAESDNILSWLKQEPPDVYDMDVGATVEVEPQCTPLSENIDFSVEDALKDPIIREEDIKPIAGASSASIGRKTVCEIKKRSHSAQNNEKKRQSIVKEEVEATPESTEPKYVPLNAYEEHQVLNQLKSLYIHNEDNVEFRRFYRKLVVRQLQRSNNIPVFDIDRYVHAAYGRPYPLDSEPGENRTRVDQKEILDRYRASHCNSNTPSSNRASFFSRLMGLDDNRNNPVISPYTSRLLKPYIFRDYKTEPMKLRLLREIVAYHHRNDPSWKPPAKHPIDFCYVRPQHIPAVNALCQDFFWPSIDMTECLQYPDFSCVALYKKVIIGFAFMVPDVKFDEAYISFILTHPDWRRAGIAKFMLYHLIQTCMGKDITLHVSATSPAVLLYQKFGFKVEEFVLDFYDKYLPVESRECRHALFLRLSR